MAEEIISLLEKAIEARKALFDEKHRGALRLFNGFTEGCPELTVDLYARTAVLYNYAESPETGVPRARAAETSLRERLPWLKAGIVKTRNGATSEEKRGKLLFGEEPDRMVEENGVRYAIDLRMNQDASL
jgi:23S rRNA (cytosine1962-C5)-methyltransferase